MTLLRVAASFMVTGLTPTALLPFLPPRLQHRTHVWRRFCSWVRRWEAWLLLLTAFLPLLLLLLLDLLLLLPLKLRILLLELLLLLLLLLLHLPPSLNLTLLLLFLPLSGSCS